MEWLKDNTKKSLDELKDLVNFEKNTTNGHEIILVKNIESETTRVALANCLLAVASQVIQHDFELSVFLLGSSQDSIKSLTNEIDTLINSTHANAWIAEAIFFILIVAAENMHSPGKMLVHTLPHTSATRQGLDGTGIYFDNYLNGLGTAITEAKNYDDLNNGISNSISSFKKIEKDQLGAELRTVLYGLTPFLSTANKEKMVSELWKQARTYIPVVFFVSDPSYQLLIERRAFAQYSIPNTHKLLVLNEYIDRESFYKSIKEEMRNQMKEWMLNV
ncbi:hypothetical protein RFW18_20755 [Metabacillus idriensis]|uniref:hypothetical protein n=1 Tax=Metabacillus idriensis TaxID=324768 RepID=UPI002813E469|nr:hypothetical protein [Metabacillus idriensis]MDR0140194.1 hypothetical protein [Metabacillus idriensis]